MNHRSRRLRCGMSIKSLFSPKQLHLNHDYFTPSHRQENQLRRLSELPYPHPRVPFPSTKVLEDPPPPSPPQHVQAVSHQITLVAMETHIVPVYWSLQVWGCCFHSTPGGRGTAARLDVPCPALWQAPRPSRKQGAGSLKFAMLFCFWPQEINFYSKAICLLFSCPLSPHLPTILF